MDIRMRHTNHSSRNGVDCERSGGGDERGQTLEELILDLLNGEFAGVMRSHSRGEVYGGC